MRQKIIANSKQGPFRVAIWHASEPAVETPESVYIHLGRDSAFVSSLKRPAIVWRWSIQNGQTWVQKNVPMWYGIVDTVLYIGRMSILVSQGAVARAYCCLLKGLGLSSLGRSLDSYCWDTSRHYQPIVSDGDVKNRFTSMTEKFSFFRFFTLAPRLDSCCWDTQRHCY